jgi:hypothetical protein
LTVLQGGKDAEWALELAYRKEFKFLDDEWKLLTTVIEQIGMSEL